MTAATQPVDAAARLRRHQVQALRAHVAVFVVSMLGMFAINLMANVSAGIADQWSAWWSAWALVGWSIGIGIHALVVWLGQPAVTREPD